MFTRRPHSHRAVTIAFAFAGSAFADEALPLVRIARFPGDRAAAISYTFDDGLRDQYTLAVPMLNEVGFKGTFFIIPGKTAESRAEGEKKQNEPTPRSRWGGICWDELKEMADQGHEIANHTWSHRNLRSLSAVEVESELSKAYDAIKVRMGKPPLTIAFPYNQSTPEVQATALKHHVDFRSHQSGLGTKSTLGSLNAWADKQIRDKAWGVVMAHAIASGYDALTDPEILRSHLRHVKSRESDIHVDTFANIAIYQKERNDAKLEIFGESQHLICLLRGTLDPAVYHAPITIVIEAAEATSAVAKRGDSSLSTRIAKGLILVDAVPGSQPITITWNVAAQATP